MKGRKERKGATTKFLVQNKTKISTYTHILLKSSKPNAIGLLPHHKLNEYKFMYGA
jgi:hypothetical protein